MHTGRSDQVVFVAWEPPSSRYPHIRFLSKQEAAVPPSSHSGSAARRITSDSAIARPREEPLDAETRRFLQWVLGRVGVDPDCYRKTPLARRLPACLRCLCVRSLTEARQRLQRQPEQTSVAASALLIGVTQFFRDPEVFSCLSEVVIPTLFAGRDDLRVWSAGCADGAELYSLAMLLAERGSLPGSTLVGTDCRADAIAQARRGWFDEARLQTLDERFRRKYFVPRQGGRQVCNELRRATTWRQDDALAGDSGPEGGWDLILCRNLAIYLEPAALVRLWRVLTKALRIGGILVAGKAERPEPLSSLVRLAPCIFEKRG